MTKPNDQSQPHEEDKELRLRVLERAKTINANILSRLSTVATDLEAGAHLAALGGLDGLEQRLATLRSLLLLLP
ncbi:MAG TPA: hypothetical protein VK578_14955 [Edaphobacter sp.]|nr:hypothetical protein [Edaphobacter sp.]